VHFANPSCAIHCRYCFRRHFPYQENTPASKEWQEAIDYIAADSTIHEVILSGGDPLSSNDQQLEKLLKQIDAIEHVRTIRFHTRLPVVIPQRITQALLHIFQQLSKKLLMVLHINHANEISEDVRYSLSLLQAQGLRLLNQSVLLKGVNDDEQSLKALFWQLHELDIQAYYLHLLDPVKGASHFWLEDSKAQALYARLQTQLPGYMLPKLVREEAFEANKTLVTL